MGTVFATVLLSNTIYMAAIRGTRLSESQQSNSHSIAIHNRHTDYVFNIHQTPVKKKIMGVAIKYWILGDVIFGAAGIWTIIQNGMGDIKSIIVFIAFVIYTFFTLKKVYWEYRDKKIGVERKEYELSKMKEEDKELSLKKI